MWVQLLNVKNLDYNGVMRRYNPGDFVDVGKQMALQWIADNTARALDTEERLIPHGVTLVWWGGGTVPDLPLDIATCQSDLPILTSHRTALVRPPFKPRLPLLTVGYSLLATWQVVCPLMSYDVLASQVGTDEARERTAAIIHDLRVPLYDPRLIFIRRCPEGDALMDTWRNQLLSDDDPALCLLRALYLVKPLVLPVPYSWMTADGKDGYEN